MHLRIVPVLGLGIILVVGCGGARASAADGGTPAHAVASRSEPRSAAELIGAMHRRYADTWYRTLSFKQTVKRTRPDGSALPEEVWSEWAVVPGLLRIDLGATHNGNGVIYRGDSLYVFRNGTQAQAMANRNALLILGFDVYGQSPERTLTILAEEGFDLSKMRRDTWQGRSAYVVGADAGDERTKQFWVDEERLVFVRLVEPMEQDTARTMEIRFDEYEALAGGWIAPLVLFLVDGREVMREEYFDIVANPTLSERVFDPARWGPVEVQ